jgi:hypothetical protein
MLPKIYDFNQSETSMLQMQIQRMQQMLFIEKNQKFNCIHMHYLRLPRVKIIFDNIKLIIGLMSSKFKGTWKRRIGFIKVQVVLQPI